MKKNIFVRIALEKDLVWEVLLSGDPGFKIGGRNSSRLCHSLSPFKTFSCGGESSEKSVSFHCFM